MLNLSNLFDKLFEYFILFMTILTLIAAIITLKYINHIHKDNLIVLNDIIDKINIEIYYINKTIQSNTFCTMSKYNTNSIISYLYNNKNIIKLMTLC